MILQNLVMIHQNTAKNSFSLLLFLCAFFYLATFSWAGDIPAQTLRVGIYPLEPIVFLNEKNQAAGIYVDIVEEIAALEHWQIEYVPGSWHDGINRLKSNEIDLMVSIAYSAERDQYFDFNKVPVLTTWGEVYLPPQSKVQNILDLKHAKIAVMKSGINGINFKRLAENFQLDCSYVELLTHDAVLQWVGDGRATAGIVPNIYGISHELPHNVVQSAIVFNAFSIYFAAAEGKNRAVLEAIDSHLRQWKSDKNSPYYKSIDVWLSGGKVRTLLPKWLISGLAVIVGLAILFAIWVKILKVQVAARTRDLKEGEQRYIGIFNSTTDAIFIHEAGTGAILDVNKSMLEMYGYGREEVAQLSVDDISLGQSPYSATEVTEHMTQAAQGEPQLFEWRAKRKDGSLFWAEVALKRFLMGEEKLISGVVRDISNRKKLEEQVVQSQKMEAVGVLAGGIAHDFNNILSAIIGYSELAELEIDTKEKALDHIGKALKGAHRAKELVRQILTFSRKGTPAKESLQIALVVKEVLKLLRSSIPSSIEIRQDIDAMGYVDADPVQIHQVVMNLCTNAFHAMEESGGVLRVALKEVMVDSIQGARKLTLNPGQYLRLAVSDSGKGMDSDTVKKIFEPYFTTKGAGKGTGLGLAVVHGIVENHHGGIYVYSESGKGTTFHVYLPVCEERTGERIAKVMEKPRGGNESVLVVDDEEDILDFTKAALERLGYTVTTFCNPVEALAELQLYPGNYQLVLTDLTMPGLSGVELMGEIRKILPLLPIVLCSGFSDKLHSETSSSQHFDAYCEKPLSISEIDRVIRKVLSSAKAGEGF